MEIEDFVGCDRVIEDWDEDLDGFPEDYIEDEGTDGLGVEFEAGGLALETPERAVGVEDAVAEEIVHGGGDKAALWVVVEVGVEDVLDVGRVGGEDEGGDGGGEGGAERDEIRSPVEHA